VWLYDVIVAADSLATDVSIGDCTAVNATRSGRALSAVSLVDAGRHYTRPTLHQQTQQTPD